MSNMPETRIWKGKFLNKECPKCDKVEIMKLPDGRLRNSTIEVNGLVYKCRLCGYKANWESLVKAQRGEQYDERY